MSINDELILTLDQIIKAAEEQQRITRKIITEHEKFEKKFFKRFLKKGIDK